MNPDMAVGAEVPAGGAKLFGIAVVPFGGGAACGTVPPAREGSCVMSYTNSHLLYDFCSL